MIRTDRQTDRLLQLLTAACRRDSEPAVVASPDVLHSALDFSTQLTTVCGEVLRRVMYA
jgi:hypothetical protein